MRQINAQRFIRRGNARKGLSLLEVILSIAILGGSLVVIGSLVNLGYQHAVNTRLRSDANIICDTTMAEVAAGVLELQTSGNQVVETNPDWIYSVNVGDSDQPGLKVVTVQVSQQTQTTRVPIIVTATRFMVDPDYEPEQEVEED